MKRRPFVKFRRGGGVTFHKGDYIISLHPPKGVFVALNETDGREKYSQVYVRNLKTDENNAFYLYRDVSGLFRITLDIENLSNISADLAELFNGVFSLS